MINMKDKGINSINYNYLNLPNSFAIKQANSAGTSVNYGINYLYRADGVKLRKTYSAGGNKITDYLDGFQYSYTDLFVTCTTCKTETAS